MDRDRRIVLNRLLVGSLIVPSLLGLGCGESAESGGQAPKAGLDELEAQNKFYQERQKNEAARK
jgi:hypothetical protein